MYAYLIKYSTDFSTVFINRLSEFWGKFQYTIRLGTINLINKKGVNMFLCVFITRPAAFISKKCSQ